MTFVSDGKSNAKLIMGTAGYVAPEVLAGHDATPAADVYSLGAMFFHLFTGLWYEPGTRALALLDGFKYRWCDVLPRMLSDNPQERPLPLSDLPRQLLPMESPEDSVPTQIRPSASRVPFYRHWGFIAAAVSDHGLFLLYPHCALKRNML